MIHEMVSSAVNIDDSSTELPVPPAAIKPTSRARTYRIPNTSDAAGALGAVVDNVNILHNTNNNTNNNAPKAAPESFLWATREIAALDFLMNVPLKAEKDIVRAGLSGGRWHRPKGQSENIINYPSGVEDDIDDGTSKVHHLSTFDMHRHSEDEGGGLSDVATTTGTELSSIHHTSHHHQDTAIFGGRWWDRLVRNDRKFFSAANQQQQRREQLELEEKELERPTESPSLIMMNSNADTSVTDTQQLTSTPQSNSAGVPGRRLDGRDAVSIHMPEEFRVRAPPLRTVARKAAVREWEIRVAYGEGKGSEDTNTAPRKLLDGRVFFTTKTSYPVAVFSIIKYEPKREETLRRRKMLEELGGGGTQFVLPERDWRGISYRSLLPQEDNKHHKALAFNRLLGSNKSPTETRRIKKKKRSSPYGGSTSSSEDDDEDTSSVSSEDSRGYPLGFLDDPQMTQGRHRNVMMGDKSTGPIISSTIQFVRPRELKADLNKQFRERFDQFEPNKSRRQYIGARVIDGVYTLIDPTEKEDIDYIGGRVSDHERENIRMPPSLTLSKIRSLKQQALVACVRGRIEISTLALACVYFERLCLDCRVDKSNRRLSFAACLLLAAKVNESNSVIAYNRDNESKSEGGGGGSQLPLMSWVKPNKKSGKIFDSLINFFTHDWSLSMKQIAAAEWIVFSALGFVLTAKPSEVAFHFKRLLSVLEWNPRSYLGLEMYKSWQESLLDEKIQTERRKARRERRIERNERRLLKLQRKLHMQQTSGKVMARHSTVSSQEDRTSHSGSTRFRRHSAPDSDVECPMPVSFGRGVQSRSNTGHSAQSSAGEESPSRVSKKHEGPVRGILSRFSRRPPRHSDFCVRENSSSHDKDMDKLSPKLEKKITAMKQSVSSPNLSTLDKKRNDEHHVAINFNSICEADNNIDASASVQSNTEGGDEEEAWFIV